MLISDFANLSDSEIITAMQEKIASSNADKAFVNVEKNMLVRLLKITERSGGAMQSVQEESNEYFVAYATKHLVSGEVYNWINYSRQKGDEEISTSNMIRCVTYYLNELQNEQFDGLVNDIAECPTLESAEHLRTWFIESMSKYIAEQEWSDRDET